MQAPTTLTTASPWGPVRVQLIALPPGTERFVLTGDELERGQIVGRTPTTPRSDITTPEGGWVLYADARVVLVALEGAPLPN